MVIFLDNAESILDPRGINSYEIYSVVEELSQFSNICLCITSRISTIPPDCKCLEIPTLSMAAACHTFYRIYNSDKPSNLVNNILEQLDFHPLSISLLATVAHHNKWDANRLNKEWERRRTDVLHTQHNNSLATTIELSLTSPMFQGLGPNARGLLGVIAFFPQGVDENNLKWLFPTVFDRTKVFDSFCILSLTYQSNGFVTMLAPLRDHLYPKDLLSSPLLQTTKDCYFSRLLVDVDPGNPGFEEARWVTSEDVNIEHLLDAFTSIDTNSTVVWDTCARFMRHLCWHKPRLVMLGAKIKGLPDNHQSKPECLYRLSRLFDSVGNYVEYKQLLIDTLKLWRERGDCLKVAETLRFLASANRHLDLYKEGINQAREALETYKQLKQIPDEARSWQALAWLLYDDKQLDAAEEAASQVINLLSDKGDQFPVCDCRCLLGKICHSRGETEKAINHLETALGIASSHNFHSLLFWNHYDLANLFFRGNRFNDAHAHIEHAKPYAVNDPYLLARTMHLQARVWYKQHRFEEAKSEALCAVEVFKGLGATKELGICRAILRKIEKATNQAMAIHKPYSDGELLELTLLSTPIDSSPTVHGTK